ncbi:MAG: GNAT family N-acetyltransferase [Gemmatimonadales bacterium]
MTVQVREASAEELQSWDQEVARFANCRVVHQRAWIRALECSGHGRPLYLIFQKGGETVAYLPGLLVTLGPLRLFGSPLQGWQTASMGPVFDPARVSTEEMFSALIPFLERRHGVDHIELLSLDLDHAAMAAQGFRGESTPTYRAQLLPGDERRMLKKLKESARRNIRRGIKLGLRVRYEEDESFVDEHYDQLKEVYLHGGNRINFKQQRVLQCFRHSKAAGNLVAVSVLLPEKDISIATAMFTIAGKELLLWTWAHRIRYRWYCPTELMVWTVMTRAMEAGCDTFDLMGRGDFKTKFGAELDSTKQRWVRSRYQWITAARDLAQMGLRWRMAIAGHLVRMAPRWRRATTPAAPPGGLPEPDGAGGSSESSNRPAALGRRP